MLLQGGKIGLGTSYWGQGLSAKPSLMSMEMIIPEGKEGETLSRDVLSVRDTMLKKMAKSSAAQEFQESVRSRNLTLASNNLAEILVDAIPTMGLWTGNHQWAITTVVVERHLILQPEDNPGEEDNEDSGTDKDISDTKDAEINTPSPTNTMQSWVRESDEMTLSSNDDLSEWEA